MSRPERITIDWLREQKACDEQVKLFAAIFGESAELTRANLIRATKADLDLNWFAKKIFGGTALETYRQAIGTAWRDYLKATDTTWDDYLKATDIARRAYLEAPDTASRTYSCARSAAWRAHMETKANVIADLLELPAGAEGTVVS